MSRKIKRKKPKPKEELFVPPVDIIGWTMVFFMGYGLVSLILDIRAL